MIRNASLDSLLSRCEYKDIIIGIDEVNPEAINAGVFFIKNSDVGLNFLRDCLETIKVRPHCIKDNKEQGQWAGPCYEQGVMREWIRTKYREFTYVDVDHHYIINSPMKIYDKESQIYHMSGLSLSQKNTLHRYF
jgi:hypothetical protein